MSNYKFLEHGRGYQLGKTLQPYRPQFSVILSLVDTKSKVLDVGCGDGVLGEKLIKQRGCQVFGIDLDIIGVEESKRKGLKAQVWDADLKLPFKENSFDIVICNEVLEYLKDPDFTLSELLRVARDKVIIEFPNMGFWFYRLQLLILGKFPSLSLYGHTWWQTQFIKFFSYCDFLELPGLKKANIVECIGIDWKNRDISFLSKLAPNLFARSCILILEPKR